MIEMEDHDGFICDLLNQSSLNKKPRENTYKNETSLHNCFNVFTLCFMKQFCFLCSNQTSASQELEKKISLEPSATPHNLHIQGQLSYSIT